MHVHIDRRSPLCAQVNSIKSLQKNVQTMPSHSYRHPRAAATAPGTLLPPRTTLNGLYLHNTLLRCEDELRLALSGDARDFPKVAQRMYTDNSTSATTQEDLKLCPRSRTPRTDTPATFSNMPDWKSPAELQLDAAAFTKLQHALLGIYAYEWFISLGFDWDFISGKKRFRWPMIFYFAGRYLLLFAMIGIAIALDTTTKINCQALYTFNQIAGNAAVGLASINLSIRTMAVWSQNKIIVGGLIVVILGHWALILQGVLLKATWVDPVGCVITSTNNTVLAATFIYSMVFDLIVLVLNAYKLLSINSKSSGFSSSRIARLIFGDGLIFFIIAFLANLLATVFMVLSLNAIMSVIFNVPAAVASTIVASRVVRRLTNFTNRGPEVYGASSSHSGQNVAFRGGQPSIGRNMSTIGTFKNLPKSGVHVQMETFTHGEEQDIESKAGVREGSDTDIALESKRRPL
ncbi:hypothetical protein LshimejAT787_1102930 [Lyophyllum shimeji]|uniref:Transmembrane protein n=1 Tax=Lyophyllum shimeji TaxID=47721 RepID=A0A9P3UR44_LYOSH|nr:hypothetical protein LshimejAT787_1102930 [Lyophyllum shimeji]